MGEMVTRAESADILSRDRCEPGSVSPMPASWPTSAATGPELDAAGVADKILSSFNTALQKQNADGVASLFRDDAFWRDHLTVGWDLHTMKGPDEIRSRLKEKPRLVGISIDGSTDYRKPQPVNFSPAGTIMGIQVYVRVVMNDGTGRGVARLAQSGQDWKIWTLYTARETLQGFEEPLGLRRAKGVEHGGQSDRLNWSDRRAKEVDDMIGPEGNLDVLIIGAGQAGLTAHARLKMLGVRALIIDRNQEVGDNWRKRYHQLVLHDPVWYDHMPYLKFPDHWPVFTPKDKLASWFAAYAEIMELNVWMNANLESSAWDEATQRWSVRVQRTLPGGGTSNDALRPKHIILATGHSGEMNMPSIPGMDTFQGRLLCHSSQFPGASANQAGKKAVVVGACNSAHDICQDFVERGYDVTMVQRSTTCVVSSEAAVQVMLHPVFSENDGPPTEDADLWLWSWPAPAFKTLQRDLTVRQLEHDAELLSGLKRAGFGLDTGPQDCGLFIKYMQRGGGYYFDVGASRLIIEGRIRVAHGSEVAEVLPHAVKLADGRELPADEVVFATGYANMRTTARQLLGNAVADRVGDVWGWDEAGEIRAMYRGSGHPGFWYMGGNLALCRYYSRLLALQIKARLEGLI